MKRKNRIKEALSIRNMKQVELCEKTGIPKGTLSNYIRQEYQPKDNVISLLAKALDVNDLWLAGYDEKIERTDTEKRMSALVKYLKSKYDRNISHSSLKRLLTNTMLYGSYMGNDNFCEPYITKSKFDHLSVLLKRNVKVYNSKRVYLFSGILRCYECGRRLGVVSVPKPNGE